MEFGDRLRELRQRKNMTQEELGAVFQLGKTAISLYESGKREPDLKTLAKLAEFFNTSTDYLLGVTDLDQPMVAEKPAEYTEKNGEENLFKAQLAANMEAEYGEKPSPELLSLAEKIYKKVLKEVAKESKGNPGKP